MFERLSRIRGLSREEYEYFSNIAEERAKAGIRVAEPSDVDVGAHTWEEAVRR